MRQLSQPHLYRRVTIPLKQGLIFNLEQETLARLEARVAIPLKQGLIFNMTGFIIGAAVVVAIPLKQGLIFNEPEYFSINLDYGRNPFEAGTNF